LVGAPGGYGADVEDLAGAEFFFEVRNGEADDFHVGFFVVAIETVTNLYVRTQFIAGPPSELPTNRPELRNKRGPRMRL